MDLTKYYTEICKVPFLSNEEEVALVEVCFNQSLPQAQRDSARATIINSNLRYVFNMARKYSRSDPSSFPDLLAAGNEGLIVGFDKYDPTRKLKVLTYCHWWIYQRIMDEMGGMRLVAIPVYKQQLSAKIQKVLNSNESISLAELKEIFKDSKISDKDI